MAAPAAIWQVAKGPDELLSTRTGDAALDDRIAKTAAKKEELLTVLSVPAVPLHNNDSELQARVVAM